MSEGQPIESGMVTRQVAKAQKKVEDRNFEIRKNLLEYDEVMDHQRTEIYAARQAVLEGEDLKERVSIMIEQRWSTGRPTPTTRTPTGLQDWALRNVRRGAGDEAAAEAATDAEEVRPGADPGDRLRLRRATGGLGRRAHPADRVVPRADRHRPSGRTTSTPMDALKAGIGLRGYGQQDPKIAYKKEATELFAQNLLPAIENDVASEGHADRGERVRRRKQGADDGLAPRGIAGPPAPLPSRAKRCGSTSSPRAAEDGRRSRSFPPEQKVMAVMQAGENEAALLAGAGPELQEKYEDFKQQIEASGGRRRPRRKRGSRCPRNSGVQCVRRDAPSQVARAARSGRRLRRARERGGGGCSAAGACRDLRLRPTRQPPKASRPWARVPERRAKRRRAPAGAGRSSRSATASDPARMVA